MDSMRKWVGFAMALVFAAFALPANAHGDDTINLVMGVAGPNLLTASVKHNDYGDQMKSFKMPFGTNVQSVTVTGVTISPNPPSTMPTVSVTGSGATGLISIATGLSLKYGQTLKLTLAVTPTGTAACGSTTSTWTATGWDSTNFYGEKYPLKSTGNVLTASVNGACTVTYNGNLNDGGSVPVDAGSYATGATVTVLGNTGSLVKTGYTFNGWNTAAAGTGTSYAAGATFAMASANVTLYAMWKAIPYTVTYVGTGSTGGTAPIDSNTYTIGTSVTVKDNGSLVKTGYTFAGWNTAADGSGTTVGATFTMGSANVTLYAKWSAIPYTVTYVGTGSTGGGVPTDGNTYIIGTLVTVLGNTGSLVKTNSTFAGWNTAADGSGTAYAGGATFTIAASSVTLYAQWTANTLAISSTQTSAAKGTAFPVKVTLTGGAQDALVTLAPSVGCPAIDPTSVLSVAASSGVANFSLKFTDVGTCTLTASASNYPSAALNRTVFAVADPGCDPNSTTFPTSINPGNTALDPESDLAYLTVGWGLRRYDNTNTTGCTGGVNFTLTTATDPGDGKPVASLLYDKLALPAGGNFKYVIVLDPRPYPADGWPALRPLVAWNTGAPDYVPGLACLSDDNETLGSLVMPTIPAGFGGGANYPDGTPARMCIAQVGWTPVPAGIQYWVKVIDQSDGGVKFP